MYNNVLTSTKI